MVCLRAEASQQVVGIDDGIDDGIDESDGMKEGVVDADADGKLELDGDVDADFLEDLVPGLSVDLAALAVGTLELLVSVATVSELLRGAMAL
jgi:hypothetical protein